MDGVKRFVLVVSLVFVFVVAGVPAVSRAAPDAAAVPVPAVRTLDGLLGEVAARAPGFGGMHLEGGVLVVHLKDPSQRAVAIGAVGAVFGAARIPAGGVRVVPAAYSFAELAGWHDRIGGLFLIPGVVLTDVDEAANRLSVGVADASAGARVESALAGLGVPRAAVSVAVVGPITPAATLRDSVRPIEGGLQIAFSNYLCTLGFNGVRAGVAGFVVNSHCTNRQGGVEGTAHYQPSVGAGNLIGTEVADPLYAKANCPAGMKGKVCRWSDSAYSARADGVTADQGFLAQTTGPGSITIAGQYRITGEGPSLAGQTVNKVGRTTGWTSGTVTSTCANVGVSGSRIVQLCQDLVSAGVGAGDSGSPVFSLTGGNDVELRGILWGGNQAGTLFVYSPIANIERADELGPIDTCAAGFAC